MGVADGSFGRRRSRTWRTASRSVKLLAKSRVMVSGVTEHFNRIIAFLAVASLVTWKLTMLEKATRSSFPCYLQRQAIIPMYWLLVRRFFLIFLPQCMLMEKETRRLDSLTAALSGVHTRCVVESCTMPGFLSTEQCRSISKSDDIVFAGSQCHSLYVKLPR